jgi:RNA polymerase sigma-70 factor, ECF subfamily
VSSSDKGTASKGASVDELALVERLRQGDEIAFRTLVAAHHRSMAHVARSFVATAADADKVVQEAWLGVLKGLERFEQRSSLKTWIFRILINCAKTRGARERRTVPFSSVAADAAASPSVPPERFRGADNPWAGHWLVHPGRWSALPEDRLMSREVLDVIQTAMDALVPAQRIVMHLRDIDGWTAEEVSDTLDITRGNQRVLLHRTRSRVRSEIESYLEEVSA